MAKSVNRALGDAFVALLDWTWPSVGPRLLPTLEAFGAIVRPHPTMSIITVDGETLTGVIVADRGRVIAFLGTRQSPSPPPEPIHQDDDPF